MAQPVFPVTPGNNLGPAGSVNAGAVNSAAAVDGNAPVGDPGAATPGGLSDKAVAINNAIFHVELLPVGDHRDLKIRRLATAPQLNVSGVHRPGGVSVKVTTEPPGAELTVVGDAEQHCQSPCVLNLPPAKQSIRAQLEGYRLESRTVDVTPAGSTLAVVLEQELGTVEFQGSQGQTPILVDGRQVARTVPALVKVPVGKYEIRTMQDGKILSSQSVEVTTTNLSIVKVQK